MNSTMINAHERPNDHGPKVGFLSLAAETRNAIYELAYKHHNRINNEVIICADKRARDFPCALARTCRQLRSETQIHFYEETTMIFVLDNQANIDACLEWVDIVPNFAVEKIKSIRFKRTHYSFFEDEYSDLRRRTCGVVYQMDFDDLSEELKIATTCRTRCPNRKEHLEEHQLIVEVMQGIPIVDDTRHITKDGLRLIFEILKSTSNSDITTAFTS